MKKLLYLVTFLSITAYAASSRFFPGRAAANISMGNILGNTNKTLTYMAWVKTSETATADWIVGKGNDVNKGDSTVAIYQDTSDNMNGYMNDGGTNYQCTGSIDTDGQWLFYAVGRASGGALFFYENEVNKCVGIQPFIGVISSTNNFKVGNSDSQRIPAIGNIGQVMGTLTSYSLTQMREFKYKPESAVFNGDQRHYWPFWGSSASAREFDLTGSSAPVTPTITGAALLAPTNDGPPIMVGESNL